VLAVGDFMSSVIDEGGYDRFGAYSRVRVGTVLPPGRRGPAADPYRPHRPASRATAD